jgi:hypothetical protein
MGHTLPMQDNAYFEPNEGEMRKAYARIYSRLVVMEQDKDERMRNMEKRIEELERLVKQLRKELEKG